MRRLLNGECTRNLRQLFRFATAVRRSPNQLVPGESSLLFTAVETLFHSLPLRQQQRVLEVLIGMADLHDEPAAPPAPLE